MGKLSDEQLKRFREISHANNYSEHTYRYLSLTLFEHVDALNAELEEYKNRKNMEYLLGYEDGRLGNKCDYNKIKD